MTGSLLPSQGGGSARDSFVVRPDEVRADDEARLRSRLRSVAGQFDCVLCRGRSGPGDDRLLPANLVYGDLVEPLPLLKLR